MKGKKQRDKTIKQMAEMIKPYLKIIAIVTLISVVVNIGEIAKPYLIKVAIDEYMSKGIWEKAGITIGMIGTAYLAIVVIGSILNFIADTTTNMMGENVVYNLRNKLYQFIQFANIPFHDKTSAGKLFVRTTNDVEDISTFFKEVVTEYLKDVILIVVILAMMLYMSIQMSLLSFIIVPFIVVSSIVITTILKKIYEKSKVIRTNVNTFLAESIYGIKLIKIFNRQKEKQVECEELNKQFRDSRNITGILEGLLPAIMIILENLGISLVIWASMEHWLGIHLEVGVIYIFVTYIKKIFEPINNIIENIEVVQEAMVSVNRIYEILDQTQYQEDLEKGRKLDKIEGRIEFKHVWFSYDNENWILKDVSFVIEPGQSIALVGKTGSGKTTITNLINRFYEIQKGEILIDGVNIQEINIRSLRKKIGIILQDPFVFATDIRENIRLGDTNISDEQVYEAIRLSSAEEFVNSLPNGMYEVAKERGTSYSAGEKQLLAFARIFAHNPSIFILDEATANIDTTTEKLIQKSIDKISAQKTSIFIAHRLATIVNVDKIIVLNKGEIVESGSHNELMQTGGYYSQLYNSYYESLTRIMGSSGTVLFGDVTI